MPYAQTPPNGAIVLSFGVRGDIDYTLITHVKFYVNRFRGFRAVTLPNLGIFIGLASGSYNSVSSAVLHCDSNKDKAYRFYFQQSICSSLWLWHCYRPDKFLIRT